MAKKKKADKEDEKEEKETRPTEKELREPVARDGAYVMMLFITLVAIIAGAVFMYLDHDEYGQKTPPKEGVPAIQKLGDKAPIEAIAPKAGGGGGDAGMPMGGMPMGGMPMGGMPMDGKMP
jgi:hypothetical protein